MPTDKEPASYLPWVIVVVLAWMLWSKQDVAPVPPGPVDPVVKNVEAITKSVFTDMKKNYAATFEEAAKQVSNKELTSDRSLLDFVKPRIEEGRKSAQAKFDAMVEANIPEKFSSDTEVARVADFLSRIGKSW